MFESHMGLNLVTVPAILMSHVPLKRSNVQKTQFPQRSRATIVLCEQRLCPGEITRVFKSSDLRCRNVSMHTITFVPPSSKKYKPISLKLSTAHQTVTQGEWSSRSWNSWRFMFGMVAKILLLYGSTDMDVTWSKLVFITCLKKPHPRILMP